MITRVLDAQGRVLHDCIEAGCETSWDGYHLKDQAAAATDATGIATTDVAVTVSKGDAVEGRADPDPKVWDVSGNVARLRKTG